MNKILFFLNVIAILLLFHTAFAASDSIINVRPDISVQEYSPGTIILLPDGRKTVIDETLPGGGWKTEDGVVINLDGTIGDSNQKAMIINPAREAATFVKGMQIDLPDGRRATIVEVLPNGDLSTDAGVVLAPDGTVREDINHAKSAQKETFRTIGSQKIAEGEGNSGEGKSGAKHGAVLKPEKIPAVATSARKKPDVSDRSEPKKTDEELTLAQMLPLTEVPGSERHNKSQEKYEHSIEPEHQQVQKTPKPKESPAREKPENASQSKKHKPETQDEKPKKEPQVKELPEKKPAVAKKETYHKTKVGQELKIPPDAAKTGNLGFLEGCWQGTRPEYYSKRTIKECFCFGANGANGKRRVIDPLGKRKCIGATKAHLSPNGVLSVTSEGAYCSDGERWGQAEMVCRNSGPKTPCSWVFRDANNGSQSYQIPFIRVESCGR